MKDVIGRYPAVDGDTGKPAENVRYAKGSDPDNWLLIDPKTAEIRLNKMPDRESKFLVNGTYTAKVICITDEMPAKTATGTIAIQVEDFNDHCPTLTSNFQTICTTDVTFDVNAVDEDSYPNGPPFQFAIVPEGTKGKWQVEHVNDTGATLTAQEPLWPGVYEVEFVVMDNQGEACAEPQKVKVQVCTCELGVMCEKRGALGQATKKSELGPAGIAMLLLGLLVLLLIPLLAFFCILRDVGALKKGFTEMPFDTKSHLISYHTEGQGENTEVPLLTMVTKTDGYPLKQGMGMNNNSLAIVQSLSSRDGMNGVQHKGDSARWDEAWGSSKQWDHHTSNSFYNAAEFAREARMGSGGLFDGMALPENILEEYYTQKVTGGLEHLKDSLLVYDNEGQDSPAGSVGCCSLLESDNDLQFLDDLGPKFKTLAEVCGGKTIPTEVKQVSTSLPSVSINTQTSVSNVVSAPQLSPPAKLQQSVTKTEKTVVKETSERSQVVNESTAIAKGGITTVKQGMGNQGQMVLLQQQPVYYTTTPMLQPMHYVVQPQAQNTVLLAEAPATNLQGMVFLNGTHKVPAQGMMFQGQKVISSGQAQGPSMLLVEHSGVQGAGPNLMQAGNTSGSQTVKAVEDKVPAASVKMVRRSQTTVVEEGPRQAGGLSGSQKIVVVGSPTSNLEQLVQEAGGVAQKSGISGSKKVIYNMCSTSTGAQNSVMGSSTTTVSSTPTYSKVVVQETKETH
ncbi:Desmoglein-2 Cadherin family member 5 HDGC Precursor [Channa argus]|uniref:Desmoglein-2 Cadherin family member 5 HDGC n=2 Tax=Channa argus TaxID=215402 RepID=A0A6G1PMI0_CHAAH|nr:Desmoglein-2 Cadherin family member 5 HDGC Precursor [Channa argus]